MIYTNRKPLLYGDFYIDMQPDADFMGTTIALGSDEFKTRKKSSLSSSGWGLPDLSARLPLASAVSPDGPHHFSLPLQSPFPPCSFTSMACPLARPMA